MNLHIDDIILDIVWDGPVLSKQTAMRARRVARDRLFCRKPFSCVRSSSRHLPSNAIGLHISSPLLFRAQNGAILLCSVQLAQKAVVK
jgi:hypothetical protein